MAIALAMLVLLLSPVLPSALAQPMEGAAGNRVDTLLRAFPNGLTPEQADAVLGLMDEAELRGALRPRLLAGPGGAKPVAAEAAPLAGWRGCHSRVLPERSNHHGEDNAPQGWRLKLYRAERPMAH